MTFVCGICKAKYQIPDQRLDGRTTMMCRDCKQPMRVAWESMSTMLSGRPSAAPPRMPSEAPVPLGLHAHLPAGVSSAAATEITKVRRPPPAFDMREVAPTVPGVLLSTPPPLHEWHVGLRDIAVGPLRGEEIGRMLAAGTLTLESPAWRRGFAGWLPIRQIPELAPANPVPVAPDVAVRAVASVPGDLAESSTPFRQSAAPRAPTARAERPARASSVPTARGERPARASSVPIVRGERPARAPTARTRSRAPQPHSIGPAPGRSAAPARSLAPGAGSWRGTLATAFGLALLMTGAAITGAHLWDGQTQSIVTPRPAVATGLLVARNESEKRSDIGPESLPVAVRPRPEPALLELPLGRAEESVQPAAKVHGKDRSSRARGRSRPRRTPWRGADVASQLRLSAQPPAVTEAPGSRSAGLTAEQLSRVVFRGRAKLQRCYEVALRGSSSESAVRTEIAITVSAAGGVVNVETSGQALPGMGRCIEHAVRKWRFPAATESTHTEFPVVFQPGS